MKETRRGPLLPGSAIGLMGGGQLGRMTALAARSLGYRVHALDPDPSCPVRGVCDHFVRGELDDPVAATALAEGVSVVTCEREDVGPESLAAIAACAPLRPGASVLSLVQDRAAQKAWLAREGFPVGPFARVSSLEELRASVRAFGDGTRLKRCRGGFDGRAQWRLDACAPTRVWEEAHGQPLIAEQELDLRAELSILIARSPSGDRCAYPAAQNFHVEGALATSAMPSWLPSEVLRAAERLATRIAERLDVVGLLAVELFWTRSGELLVNELAPRPHNTFHSTEWACETSQFEQLVRAICDLPLGPVAVRRPTAIANLYGDLWLDGRQEALASMLRIPGLQLRLYDKVPRARRKLGHFGYTADSAIRAHEGVRAIQEWLTSPGGQPTSGEGAERTPPLTVRRTPCMEHPT